MFTNVQYKMIWWLIKWVFSIISWIGNNEIIKYGDIKLLNIVLLLWNEISKSTGASFTNRV